MRRLTALLVSMVILGTSSVPIVARSAPSDLAPSDLAPSDLAPSDLAPAELATAELAPANLAPADLADALAPSELAPSDVASANLAPADLADALATADALAAGGALAPSDLATGDALATADELATAELATAELAPSGLTRLGTLRIRAIGLYVTVYKWSCSEDNIPNRALRWRCSGTNNQFIFGHAYGVFHPYYLAWNRHDLKRGIRAVFTDTKGHVTRYKLAWARKVPKSYIWDGKTGDQWAWNPTTVPSITLQTCWGATNRYRIVTRLVKA